MLTPDDLAAIRAIVREELASRRKKKPDGFLDSAALIADGVHPKHAADWLAIRKKKNLPLTDTAWDDIKKQAELAGIPVSEAVRISCSQTWAGFRASWMDKVKEEFKQTVSPEIQRTRETLKAQELTPEEVERAKENARKVREMIPNLRRVA